MTTNGRRIRAQVLALLIPAAGGALHTGCTRESLPTGGTNIIITNTNTNTQGGGPGGTTPSPSPSAGPVNRVGIGVFGEAQSDCDPGKSPAGAERDTDVRVGCVAAVTCSPFDAAGNEMFPPSIPGAPDRFTVISGEGSIVRSSEQGNPYNLDVKCISPGAAVMECSVAGVSSNASPRGPFRLTCVS